jgi:hypothetical protein
MTGATTRRVAQPRRSALRNRFPIAPLADKAAEAQR